jgi:hypothetical protein
MIEGTGGPGIGMLVLCVASSATAASTALTAARQAYKDFEYDRVLPLLETALGETQEPADRIAIFELEATMHVMYGRDEDAIDAFGRLLATRPDFELGPTASPKLRQVFEVAKNRRAIVVVPPSIGPTVPAAPPATAAEVVTATAPVEAGQATAASRITPPAPEAPLWREWWLWASVGAVVVAVAGGSYLIWRATIPGVPDSEFGPFDLGY